MLFVVTENVSNCSFSMDKHARKSRCVYFATKYSLNMVKKNSRKTATGGPGMCLQLIVATSLVVAGCVLLACAFIAPPEGEIHSSVLVAFGEILTFSGALFGIDYSYRSVSSHH